MPPVSLDPEQHGEKGSPFPYWVFVMEPSLINTRVLEESFGPHGNRVGDTAHTGWMMKYTKIRRDGAFLYGLAFAFRNQTDRDLAMLLVS